jgi:hypothetical protein
VTLAGVYQPVAPDRYRTAATRPLQLDYVGRAWPAGDGLRHRTGTAISVQSDTGVKDFEAAAVAEGTRL